MNCRPGDLARIVGLHPCLRLNDKIVKLADEPPFMQLGAPHWRLETPIELTLEVNAFNSLSGERWSRGSKVVLEEVPDQHLRPIRDPGSDAVDEIVARVGAAPKTLTEVREVSHG